MNVAINTHIKGKPKTKQDHKNLTFECKNFNVTAEELSRLVKHGYSFCAQHKDNHRKTANFIQAGFIAVDIDKDKTIDEVLSEKYIKNYCSFIYTTENHSCDFHRFRIVFELDNPITSSVKMRNALTGIIQKFGGDVTCKDATRLFYGSRNCETHWIGKTLPDNKLDEIVLLGDESNSVKNSQENAGELARATVQSRSVINPETLVKVKGGCFEKIIDIPPNTKVHCPVHVPDKNASAFTIRSGNNVPGVHCSTCGKTYFTSSQLPIFDFNYDISSLNNLNKEEVIITDEEEYLTHEEVDIKRFNEPYLPYIKTNTPLVLIKSPKGTGKTQWLARIVRYARASNYSVLLIGHRRSLITSVANRLLLSSYLNPSYFDKETKQLGMEHFTIPTKYYAICADSLSTLLDPERHKYDIVIIDEVEQVFSHLTSATVKDRRNETLMYFKHYLDAAKKVYVTDADLNYLTVDTIYQFVSNKQREVTFLINDYKPKSSSIEIYGSRDHLLKHLIDSISRGERVFVCSNSKTKIIELTGYIEETYGSTKKVLGITSSNSQDSDIQKFIQNIKTEILEYDVVLVSPSMGTGVDITFPENKQEIDCVYGFFEARVNTHFDIDQQLSRVRHPKKIRAWISPEQFRFETNQEVIMREVALTDRSVRKLLHIDVDGKCIYDEPNKDYLNLYSNVRSLQRGSKNHLRKQFIKMKEHYGWEIIYIELDKLSHDEGVEISQHAKEISELARVNQILSAPIIDKDEYTQLKIIGEKYPMTEFHRYSMRRYEIESFYYSDVTKKLIELDKDGKFRIQIREYENYTAEESDLMALDRLEIEKYTPHISDRKQLLSRRNFLKKVFELAGLSDDEYPLITNKAIHKDQLNDCIDYLKKNNVKIQRWFNNALRSDIDKNPVAQLGAFLKLFGIKWKKTTKKRSDGGKDYYYEIPHEIIDLLDSMVNTRKDSQFKEKWHLDRSNITENRLFPQGADIRYLIRRQIKTQKINPVKKTDSW